MACDLVRFIYFPISVNLTLIDIRHILLTLKQKCNDPAVVLIGKSNVNSLRLKGCSQVSWQGNKCRVRGSIQGSERMQELVGHLACTSPYVILKHKGHVSWLQQVAVWDVALPLYTQSPLGSQMCRYRRKILNASILHCG